MTLRNLLNTGQLAEHETDAVQVRRMLIAAQRGIDDAKPVASKRRSSSIGIEASCSWTLSRSFTD